jgi:hypothetical protein
MVKLKNSLLFLLVHGVAIGKLISFVLGRVCMQSWVGQRDCTLSYIFKTVDKNKLSVFLVVSIFLR